MQVPAVAHTWVAGPTDRRRYTTIAVLRSLTQPQFIFVWTMFAVLIVGGIVTGSPSIVLPIAVALGVCLPVMVWWGTYRALRTSMLAGAQWTSGFNEHAMMFANPGGMVVLGWDRISSVTAKSDVVVVKTKDARGTGFVLPSPLFPAPAVTYAHQLIRS